MKLEIICDGRDSAILVGDEHHNDIAEFYHNEHATVGQSYETALELARKLVASEQSPVAWRCRWKSEPDWKYGERPCSAEDHVREEPGFEEQALSLTNGERK
jgi:hypothetical protein